MWERRYEKSSEKSRQRTFAGTWGQAHDEIKNAMERGDRVMAQELLEQCQQGAIQLGTLIETTEGEGFVTVGILEEYCELVYRMFDQLSREEKVNSNEACQQLCHLWTQITDSVRTDIKVRLEAVFCRIRLLCGTPGECLAGSRF